MKTKTDDLQIRGGQEGGEDQPEVNNDQDLVLNNQLMMHLKKSLMSLVQKNLKKVNLMVELIMMMNRSLYNG